MAAEAEKNKRLLSSKILRELQILMNSLFQCVYIKQMLKCRAILLGIFLFFTWNCPLKTLTECAVHPGTCGYVQTGCVCVYTLHTCATYAVRVYVQAVHLQQEQARLVNKGTATSRLTWGCLSLGWGMKDRSLEWSSVVFLLVWGASKENAAVLFLSQLAFHKGEKIGMYVKGCGAAPCPAPCQIRSCCYSFLQRSVWQCPSYSHLQAVEQDVSNLQDQNASNKSGRRYRGAITLDMGEQPSVLCHSPAEGTHRSNTCGRQTSAQRCLTVEV